MVHCWVGWLIDGKLWADIAHSFSSRILTWKISITYNGTFQQNFAKWPSRTTRSETRFWSVEEWQPDFHVSVLYFRDGLSCQGTRSYQSSDQEQRFWSNVQILHSYGHCTDNPPKTKKTVTSHARIIQAPELCTAQANHDWSTDSHHRAPSSIEVCINSHGQPPNQDHQWQS